MISDRRKPALFSYPDHISGPSCYDFPGCTCNIMPKYSVRGFGNPNAKVMLVGIAPGRQEETYGAPLVGPSGERNDLCLAAVKYPREKVYATNLICWRNDLPDEEQIAACWPRLRTEIEMVRPKLILALGALACEWLTGYQIGKIRGNIIRPEYNRSEHFADLCSYYAKREGPALAGLTEEGGDLSRLPTILPTWHPAATLRIASLATDVLRDYRKIRPFLKGRYEPLQWDWHLVEDRQEAQEVLDSLEGQRVAVDVETEKDLTDAFGKVVCVAMAVEDPRDIRAPNGDPAYFAYVFPVEVLRGLRWPRKVQWLQHNMGYDTPIIKREFGIWLTGVTDTMILSQCIDERPSKDDDSSSDRSRSGEASKPKGPGLHGLKQLSAEFCGAPPGYGDEMKKSFGKTLEEIAAPQQVSIENEEPYVAVPLYKNGDICAWTLVDVGDLEIVGQYRWHVVSGGYVARVPDGQTVYLAREILGLPRKRDGRECDHRNRSKLDNRRNNLRITTRKENTQNLPAIAGTSSSHRGVSLIAKSGKWRAQVRLDGKVHYLGEYVSEEAAALIASEFRAETMPFSEDAEKKSNRAKAKLTTRWETHEEAKERFDKFLQDLFQYNAFDAVNTVALPSRLPGKPCAAFETIIMPAARAYARIHLQGIPVDLERAKELQAEWEPWINELEAELQLEADELGYRNQPTTKRDTTAKEAYEGEEPGSWPLGLSAEEKKALRKEGTYEARQEAWLAEHGPNSWPGYEPINLGSSQQLGKLLYGILKIPVKVRSKKTGKPSVGKEAVASISHPFVERMEEVRTAKHIKASHLDPIPELVKGDGRIHPNIWVIGATNYRRSMTNPPMQQFPIEHPKPFWSRLAEVRSVIRPEPGYCLIESDYRQVELWCAALLSGDKVFLDDMRSGDYHTRILRDVFHCDEPEGSVVFTHTRRISKIFNFSVIYKVEENTLSKTMNEGSTFGSNTRPTTPREAGRLIRQWYARNRVYGQWQDEVVREVKQKGRLINPFGEIRRMPLWDPLFEKQAVNYPISSTAAAHSEISLTELEPIMRREFGGQVLFDTHDSILFHVPIKKRRSAARIIREVMTEPRIPGWPPLDIEMKYSTTSWRAMKVWDERT